MTIEETIKWLKSLKAEIGKSEHRSLWHYAEALDMAIEALQTPPISQRRMYQAGYRQGREEALKQVTGKLNIPDDSLLTADSEVCKEQKSKLDLISRAEAIEAITETLDAIDHVPKWVFDKLTSAIEILSPADRSTDGDLISRAEAIEAIELVDWYHQNKNKDMVHGANDDEHQAWYKADDVYKALEAIPSVDKQRNGDLIIKGAKGIKDGLYVIKDGKLFKFKHKGGTVRTYPIVDRPRGEWVEQEDDYHHYWECSECGMGVGLDDIRNFCPNCGSDNRERREE